MFSMKSLNTTIFLLFMFTSCNFSIFSPETELEYDTSFEVKFEPITNSSKPFLHGKVIDLETGEGLLLANVAVYLGHDLVTGVQTDFDGFFHITNIDIGTYNIEASYVGYRTNWAKNITVKAGSSTEIHFLQKINMNLDIELTCGRWHSIPLIKQDETTSGQTFDSEFIKRMAW